MKYRGVAYYPEYWPEERWAEDIRLMQEAGINLVRVGEFAWTALEPAEGRLTLEWLQRLVEQMGAASINVMLCTPTATPPAWLTDQYPEVSLVAVDGRPLEHGRRRHYCPTHPVYRRHVRRITEAMSRKFSRYANVVSWQLDNELGPESGWCHCHYCQSQFRVWLQQRYGSLAELNRRWGTRFWSVEYSAWEQIRLAHGDQYSAALLDTSRFRSDCFVDFAAEQARVIRTQSPRAVITTNGMGPLYPPINYYDLFGLLDVAADDLYFDIATQDGNAMAMDLHRNIKPGQSFWINETGSGALSHDKVPTHGQVRAWGYAALARGCESYCFFRWRTCLSGQEQELQGVIEYSGRPRLRYAAVQDLYREWARLEPQLTALPLPTAEVTMLLDYDVLWGYQASRVDSHVHYTQLFQQVYRAFYQRNVPVDILPPERDFSHYQLLVLPSLMMVDEALAARLRAFVEHGGTILSMPQLACRDRNDNYLPDCAPVGLRELFGLRVEGGMYLRNHTGPDQALWVPEARFADETPRVRINGPDGETIGTVRSWMEDVEIEDAEELGSFLDNDFAGRPFLIARQRQAGSTLYCAAYPDPALMEAIVAEALSRTQIAPPPRLPEYVEIVTRGDVTFLINHRKETITIPVEAGEALLGDYHGGQVTLGAYDVCLLRNAVIGERATVA